MDNTNFNKTGFGWLELKDYTSNPTDTSTKYAGICSVNGAAMFWNKSSWAAIASGGSSHAMLSSTHTDSTAGTCTRGDIITAQGATAKWTRLAKGDANKFLIMGAAEPGWSTYTLALTGNVTTGGALTFSGAYAATFTLTNTTSVTLPTSGTLMANPMSTAGALIYGGVAGAATSLVIGAANTVLKTDGTNPSWGALVNANIDAAAAIAWSKMAALASAHILVGSAGNVATDVALTGDVAITNAGLSTVTDLTITSEAAGDLLYFNGVNWVRLAKPGSAGYFLEGGTTPAWSLPSLASASSIQTGATLLDAGANDATITFTTQTTGGASVVVPDFNAATAYTFAFKNFAQTWTANQTVQYGKLYLGDSDNGQTLQILVNENMTGDKTITIQPNDTNRTIHLHGDIDLGGTLTTLGAWTQTGAHTIGITTTNNTTLTLPVTGTLATLAGAESLSTKTLTAPKIVTTDGIMDAGGDEYLIFVESGTPVNFLTITSADTGVAPMLTASGSDDNVDLMLHGKGTGNVVFTDGADITAKVVVEIDGATTGKTMTLTCSHTDNRALTLPDATDTLVGKATTDTLTNKTIDCDGTGNVITNVNHTELDPVGDAAFGIPFVVSKTVANLAEAGTNIVTTNKKLRVLDAWFVATSADSGTIAVHAGQVGSVGTAIVDAITVAAADKGVSRAASINDAAWDLSEDGGLVAVGDGGASIDGTIYVMCMRIN